MDATPWLDRLCKLKLYSARHGPAPHKPLLLLVLIDLAEQERITGNTVELTPELALRFSVYASVVAHRRTQPVLVRYPFFHLQNDGFWRALDQGKKPASDDRHVRFAVLEPGFRALLQNADDRAQARRLIIAKYFPRADERAGLYAAAGVPMPPDEELARDTAYEPIDEAEKKGREARFRIQVMYNYQFTCALTGYCLTTIDAGSIVDAAHIHPFADSRNNDPRNGLALTKDAHWLFDNGLWTVKDDYRVTVAMGQFAEHCRDPAVKGLAEYEGSTIYLPKDEAVWPDRKNLEWHRMKRFKGAAR
jgi:putative restriction endonuclease